MIAFFCIQTSSVRIKTTTNNETVLVSAPLLRKKPVPGTGTLPVWFQGRSALAAGGYRREAKLLHGKIENFAA